MNDDKVRVASPQCMAGRNSAEYSISVDKDDQNYATSMTKTGEYGVQWGDEETADFYSIYPSTEMNISVGAVTAKLTVAASQFASITDKVDSIYAQPAEMGNVVMYAKSTAKKTDPAVKLHYTPFSTVLEFEINASNEVVAGKQTEITIQSLTLTAPTGTTIAGNFGFTFPTGENTNPSIEAATGGSNTITMHFLDNNQYTTVLSTKKRTLKAKMCLMPISGVNSLSGWKIEVNTSAGTFSKTLDEDDLTGKNTALAPGKVHKIKLPTLNYASQEWVYNTANWITSLPDYTNIYLSELSLPGAWYAGSKESYQATNDIAILWNAGVRAFAVETRTAIDGISAVSVYTAPTKVVVSGSGNNTSSNKSGGTNSLKVTTGDKKAYVSGTNVSTIITNIANQVKTGKEYAVLVLSYADGGDGGHRSVDYGAWLQLLYNEYNSLDNSIKEAIYQGSITSTTTVADVIGKLIIKVNVDKNIAMEGSVTHGWNSTSSYSYNNKLPAL